MKGSYDPKDEYVPSYKTYLSSGFASKSRRAFDVGINPKYRNESGGSSLYGSQKGTEASEGVVEYIEVILAPNKEKIKSDLAFH